ncbi:CU044_5270 family protein, partial [Microbispora sp. ATCC PTA-5024]|uniref:CU044_5270 family protein n=1 Tax=Microbispora sp. ATCC PTA-5024 TaxID=316330 RepID=UPI0003DD8CBB
LAVAAAVAVVAVAPAGPEGTPAPGAPVTASLPAITRMSAEEVLGRAARAVTDLHPRDDQFIEVRSQTMYGAFGGGGVSEGAGQAEPETRYLYRSRRTIWLSADGTRPGALKIEYLAPRAYPGWPIPEEAHRQQGTMWALLPACDQTKETAYTHLKGLPSDPDGMRAYLYGRNPGDNPPDVAAWTAVGDLLRENYLPAPQRAALFKAAATIPGVTVTDDAEDAAGRTGIGVGRVSNGVREDIVFDRGTYELLGERGIVVDEKEAKAPLGSLVASTAQLEVTVADVAPKVDDPNTGCG